MVDHSLADDEFVDEVRTSMADLGEQTVPTDTILQQWKRQVKPFLEDNTDNPDQSKVDNAAIFMTAEKSFKSWVQKSRMTTSGQDTYIEIEGTIDELEAKTASALSRLDITYQPERGPAPFVDNTEGFYS